MSTGLQLLPRNRRGGSSLRTVLTAAAANLAIALAKAVAAVLTGSVALWAEAVHSVADTGNEVLLFVGLRRSNKVADAQHPFGYGQERYFWALLASFSIFLIGGLLSIAEGVNNLRSPQQLTSPSIGGAVLIVAAVFEAYSWRTSRRQLSADARLRRRSFLEHLGRGSDPSPTAVYLEDSAALIGIALALAGLLLHDVTGWAGWESIASIGIGGLLIAVAVLLARRSKALLIDESVPPDTLRRIRGVIEEPDWVAAVPRLAAIFVGPARLLITARVVPPRPCAATT